VAFVSRFVSHDELRHAANLIRAGKLVAFPTETVYGLGANALDPAAVARIFAVKRRPATSPLIVHVASIEMAESIVAEWPDTPNRPIMTRLSHLWPGPLTLVLKKKPVVPDLVTANLPTVAVRMPAHPVAQALIREAGVPIAAPSANRFTQLSPTTAEHVRQSLGNDVDFILDGGSCQVGIESTVLSLATPVPTLLRPGMISRTTLEAALGSMTGSITGPIVLAGDPREGSHPSPGMHARHYSPRTPLHLVENGALNAPAFRIGRGVYLQHRHAPNRLDLAIEQMPDTADEYAARIYEVLHRADEAAYDWIAVDLPPRTPEWEAVHDRLKRAASE
jgi:L-threonylcarbamoyladenylate synthase